METLADLDTPVSTYLKLADAPYTYLFESVVGGDEWGRYSIIGLPANEVFRVLGNTISHEVAGVQVDSFEAADPLEEVRKLQNSYRVAPADGLPEMFGGLVGFFGYESIAYIEDRLANQDKPDAIAWLIRNHPELTDAQISKLVGTTKPTITAIRERTHWNMSNIKPVDPVLLGLCKQLELDAAVKKAAPRRAETEKANETE
ncbi:MAG: DUF1013 domain-containing protein [Proteobacteria bacterium]|nr:DUF1013 domain-containing protein [Pseudomonadota bacterium]